MKRPKISMHGCRESAFRLFHRAKKAIHAAGMSDVELARFSLAAGQSDVVQFASPHPPEVYQRVLYEVKRHCSLTE